MIFTIYFCVEENIHKCLCLIIIPNVPYACLFVLNGASHDEMMTLPILL